MLHAWRWVRHIAFVPKSFLDLQFSKLFSFDLNTDQTRMFAYLLRHAEMSSCCCLRNDLRDLFRFDVDLELYRPPGNAAPEASSSPIERARYSDLFASLEEIASVLGLQSFVVNFSS